jgi:F-type H+-transporting ATPase subunit d
MSGVKKVTDLAAKAGKAIDWDGMAKMLVSEEARKEFANLRRTFEDVNHQLQTKYSQVTCQSPPPHTVSRSPDRSGQCG